MACKKPFETGKTNPTSMVNTKSIEIIVIQTETEASTKNLH